MGMGMAMPLPIVRPAANPSEAGSGRAGHALGPWVPIAPGATLIGPEF